jgi:hypothetical protein
MVGYGNTGKTAFFDFTDKLCWRELPVGIICVDVEVCFYFIVFPKNTGCTSCLNFPSNTAFQGITPEQFLHVKCF